MTQSDGFEENAIDRCKKLDKSISDYSLNYDSSDSEYALDDDSLAAEASHNKRRSYNKEMIGAIAETALPVPTDFRIKVDYYRSLRKRDLKDDKIYKEDTLSAIDTLSELIKPTSYVHNPILRRAFRENVTKEEAIKGGVDAYNAKQSKIRGDIPKQIKRKMEEVDISSKDYKEPKKIRVIEKIIQDEKMNGAINKKKVADSLHEDIGSDLTNNSFGNQTHHIAFKGQYFPALVNGEVKYGKGITNNKYLEKHALNPLNLCLVGGKIMGGGSHDSMHYATGFAKKVDDDILEKHHRSKEYDKEEANRYNKWDRRNDKRNMDERAVTRIIKNLSEPRQSKSEIYGLGIRERIMEHHKNNDQTHNSDAIQGVVSKMDSLDDEQLNAELKKTASGRIILERQEKQDSKFRHASLL